MIYAGIDAGSRAIKIILFDSDKGQIIDYSITDQGVQQDLLIESVYEALLRRNNLKPENIRNIIATGYGRNIQTITSNTITEITCHARGVRHLIPHVRTIIEIGGQDSKLLKLNADGKVQDFTMNDRCAAGTGRFLEVVANRLSISLDELGYLAARSKSPAVISSMCVVFAETEIIGLLSSGIQPEDIVAGVMNSIASRIMAMAGRNLTDPLVFTGGVALIPGMDKAISKTIDKDIEIVQKPQYTGALGAALLGETLL
jgi:(R)-2-hydroxyacyl-CoA dehydratese activating ATPase